MLPRRLQTSLLAAQLVAFATLARSVAYDRWFTVVVASLMIVGALAAVRHRTWGLLLALATAVTFVVAALIGIAPIWFVGVGALGALPFLLTSEALVRFDRQATTLLAGLATGVGATVAMAWKLVAWDVFVTFPILWPGSHVRHGLAVLAVLATGALVAFAQRDRSRRPRVRAAVGPERVRIAEAGDDTWSAAQEQEEEAEAYQEVPAATPRTPQRSFPA